MYHQYILLKFEFDWLNFIGLTVIKWIRINQIFYGGVLLDELKLYWDVSGFDMIGYTLI